MIIRQAPIDMDKYLCVDVHNKELINKLQQNGLTPSYWMGSCYFYLKTSQLIKILGEGGY